MQMSENKVLVLQLSRLGDLLQSTVLLNSLKNSGKTIYLLGDEKNRKIAEEIDLIDYFIPFEIGYYLGLIKNNKLNECIESLKNFIRSLQLENFNELYNLNHSEINLIISSLLNIPVKKGFKVENNEFINFIYSVVTDRKKNRFNLVDIFNHFFEKPIYAKKLIISTKEKEKNIKFIEKIFKNENIVLHLGAGHKLREWGVLNFANLSNIIFKTSDFTITLTGTKSETLLGREFTQHIAPELKNRIINLIGKTDISLLKSILIRSELLISTDTGVMHLASACGTKTISLFYASAFPFETGPYSENAIMLSPEISCYPCTEFQQFCSNVKCKNLITPEDIFQAFLYFIGEISYEKLKSYADINRERIVFYKPYFDKFGICYSDILKNERFDKIRLKGFGYARKES